MWWHEFWGTWRYQWLEDKMKNALRDNKNVDDIFRQVFNTISFSHHHTDKHYTALLSSIEMRSDPDQGATLITREVFSLETVCAVVNSIPTNSRGRAWEIVYCMTKLRYEPTNGMDKTLLNTTLNALRKLLIKMVDEGVIWSEPWFLYCVGVHDIIEIRVRSKVMPFPEGAASQVQKARENVNVLQLIPMIEKSTFSFIHVPDKPIYDARIS